MNKLHYTLVFHTPAFMGNAEQNAQWRTPPIKALLRQWWRVAYAADHNFNVDVAAMRQEEGQLFGVASDQRNGSRQSLVRIRLDRWDDGKLKKSDWPHDIGTPHREVKNRAGQIQHVGSALYLGYGPLEFNKGTSLKKNAAIRQGESAMFSLAIPTRNNDPELQKLLDENVSRILHALSLMDRFGTLGGRSRNGWGSFALHPLPEGERWAEGETLPLRDWQQALSLDWPHAIGGDARGPLVWQTAPQRDWQSVMKTLAEIKIGLRTQFRFPQAEPDGQIHDRHWLSYPVTRHSVRSWGGNARLPNQLRFKVRQTDDGQLVGVIFHVPHQPPASFRPDRRALETVWRQVHVYLDHPSQNLTRISE